jgi:hypothetical protein
VAAPDPFVVVAAGRCPFTTSACLAHEWSLAPANGTPATPSLYFNTGYAGAYAKQITAGCKNAVANAPIPPSTSGHQKSPGQAHSWPQPVHSLVSGQVSAV